MVRIIVMTAMALMISAGAKAQGKFVERSTDVLCIVPTMTGLCMAIVNDDKK